MSAKCRITADGQTMTILPEESACLNCLMLDGPPPPGTTPTCDSFGILAPIINVIASIEANEAIKILSGNRDAISPKLTVISMWENTMRQMDLSKLREQVNCPTCQQHQFDWLNGDRGSHSAVLFSYLCKATLHMLCKSCFLGGSLPNSTGRLAGQPSPGRTHSCPMAGNQKYQPSVIHIKAPGVAKQLRGDPEHQGDQCDPTTAACIRSSGCP